MLLSATARAPLTMLRIFSTRHHGTHNISKVQRVFGFEQMRQLMHYDVIKNRHRLLYQPQVNLRNKWRIHMCIAKT
jgi:hypothetical protein